MIMQNIFLIGLSGSGKSAVGRILAERLNKPFLNTDVLIEEECSERISAIFAHHGENYFRACESRVLARAAQTAGGAIIATGGGIVMRAENRALIDEQGTCIYLQIEPTTALERLQAQQTAALAHGETPAIRPLLAGPDPLAALNALLAACSAWYEAAHWSFSTQNKSAERIAQEIIAMLIGSGKLDPIPPIRRHIHVGAGYDAIVDWGGLGRLAQYLTQLNLPMRIFLITDSHIRNLYAPTVVQSLSGAGFNPQVYTVPAGEASKSQSQLNAIYDWLVEHHAERREAIVALGGGVVGDLAGYAAATYLRGVPLVQVPTSLLAQVDAAIGGKTGINHPRGKNLIGAFYQPKLVLADPATLLTLPVRERTEGWAEVVKYGIILDAELFTQLEAHAHTLRDFSHPPAVLLCQLIARCIALKASVIEEDEHEQGRRAILNYGHTVGHALENVAGYGEWLHGEAVSLGMILAAAIAQQAGMFADADVARQRQLLSALGLPVAYQGTVRAQDIFATMQVDKKVTDKRIRWVMPQRIGEVIVTTMPGDLVRGVVTSFFTEKRKETMSQDSISQLRTWIAEQKLDAFMVTQPQNRSYLSGWFNDDNEGAGLLLVGQQQQIVLTNSLYKEIAEREAVGWQVTLPPPLAREYAPTIVELAQKHGWKKIGFESMALLYGVYEQLRSAGEGVLTLHPFEHSFVSQLRLVKQPHEIELLRHAIAITDEAFAHICQWIQPGMTEKEVAWEISRYMLSLGADSPSFETIVASGPNGSMPHAIPGQRRIERGELVTIDMGARYKGYCADMTRTICLDEPAEPRMREIYAAVLRAMKTCEAGLHAGISGLAADALARDVLEKDGLAEYYVHGTGHGVGLQIHEGPHLSPRSPEDMILPAGSVVTVEPGVYIPGWSGVRVEDCVLVTQNGSEVLTQSPTELVIRR